MSNSVKIKLLSINNKLPEINKPCAVNVSFMVKPLDVSVVKMKGYSMFDKLSPQQFYRSAHPEFFSDSTISKQATLDRNIFEYHLSTLTSRSQEKDFENFCRALAEKEICPNLIVQTGPTGGGDSKVDTETYPVADAIAQTWFMGIGREAASERWAFAISAKMKWKDKLKSDVRKIADADRDYKLIFFISNQFISDKQRATVEGDLSAEIGIKVRILDKSWIVEKVFTNNRIDLAVRHLRLSETFLAQEFTGPLDSKRKVQLAELERSIANASARKDFTACYQYAIDAAVLSRELEQAETQTVELFVRAFNFASRTGLRINKIECIYQWAWSLYWWYENYVAYYEKYNEFEALLSDSVNLDEFEKLINLWLGLFRTDSNGVKCDFDKHNEFIRNHYIAFQQNQSRPNVAAQAKVLFMSFRCMTGDSVDSIVVELLDILDSNEHSIYISFGLIKRFVTELPIYQSAYDYDRLFEKVVFISSEREKASETASLLISRARQIEQDKPYTAIRLYGRAIDKLVSEESVDLLLKCLFSIGTSLERVELFWAARGYYLNCFALALERYFEFGKVPSTLAFSLGRAKMIESRHGRVIHAAMLYELECIAINMFLSQNPDSEFFKDLYEKATMPFDLIEGTQILHTEFCLLSELEYFPAYLDNIGLHQASIAVQYLLGHVKPDVKKAITETHSVSIWFDKWRSMKIEGEDVKSPWYGIEKTYVLHSNIVGCQIEITAVNSFPCIEVAETLLANIESFLATAAVDNIYSMTPRIGVSVSMSDSCFEYTEHNNGVYTEYRVLCTKYPNKDIRDTEFEIEVRNKIMNLAIHIATTVGYPSLSIEKLEKLVSEDNLFYRASTFTDTTHVIYQYFNKETPSIRQIPTDTEKCEFVRVTPVEFTEIKPEVHAANSSMRFSDFPVGTQEEYAALNIPKEQIKQSDYRIDETIKITLWDKAGWTGIAILHSPNEEWVAFSPMFKNREAAELIFKDWIQLFGNEDKANAVHITVITGISQSNPHHYRVVISGNPAFQDDSNQNGRFILNLFRSHTMEPSTNVNLQNFRRLFNKNRSFRFFPSYMEDDIPEPLLDYCIEKASVDFIEAWTIDRDSLLVASIFGDDDPIIPSTITDAPVLSAIAFAKQRNIYRNRK